MKRLLLAAGLLLATAAAHAQGTSADTLRPRQRVDLQNDGVTTVTLRQPAASKPTTVKATGARMPQHKAAPATHKSKTKTVTHGSGPTAYYCASGNTVKYHASATCRGLERCNASIQKMALADAQQQMDACLLCH